MAWTRWIREDERRGYGFGAVANVCAVVGILLSFPGAETRPDLRVLAVAALAASVVFAVLSLVALIVLGVRQRRR
ncbi:hypothetical protein ACQPX6_16600 [Actinomycetospora sp. CA-101289]|uniref:hypothetical protein n=1 Tax=Actinomycetospora sp. CA-101289 TaxID=3239893 RepID=UPI003D969355